MANINFDQINVGSGNANNGNNVGFFTLKNDGDEAIVRIMHDSTADFNIMTTHSIQIDGKFRRVNCIRTPMEPMDKCPLCASGEKVQQRIYIHLIQYVRDESGAIVPRPMVWERSIQYAVTLKNLIDEYGPLSDSIFKVRRSGAPGQRDTSYSIMYGNPNVYRSDMYPKVEGAFDKYKVLGTAVMDKTYDEIATFVSTGVFPAKQTEEQNGEQSATPVRDFMANPSITQRIVPQTVSNPQSANVVAEPYVETVSPFTHVVNDTTTTAPQRPVRYY